MDTQFKRAVARAFRNAITRSVSKDVREIILGWVGIDPKNPVGAALALGLDKSNDNKWEQDGTLQLRVLTQILVQQRKDFTDIVHGDTGARIIGPEGAYLLQIEGCRAALEEGYRLRNGNLPEALEDDLAEALILLYASSRNPDRLEYQWVLQSSQLNQQASQRIKAALRNPPSDRLESTLATLAERWSGVCVSVCKVLEEHAGLEPQRTSA